MHIKQLTIDDVAEIFTIGRSESAFEVAEECSFWTQEQLNRWVESGEDVLLVAKNDEKILGFALSTLHKPTGKATWENLYVHPSARNQGVGDKLTAEVVRQLHSKGATHICFFVRAENSDEIAYFKKRGFVAGHNFIWFVKHA